MLQACVSQRRVKHRRGQLLGAGWLEVRVEECLLARVQEQWSVQMFKVIQNTVTMAR